MTEHYSNRIFGANLLSFRNTTDVGFGSAERSIKCVYVVATYATKVQPIEHPPPEQITPE